MKPIFLVCALAAGVIAFGMTELSRRRHSALADTMQLI